MTLLRRRKKKEVKDVVERSKAISYSRGGSIFRKKKRKKSHTAAVPVKRSSSSFKAPNDPNNLIELRININGKGPSK